ncbi:PIN domain-containing protein [Kitasatospora sp. NPDC004723]|uniref:PIN domain-containing protein n=1 Tax=Kitasatospora sp. NPDC004723 TaxID=3154288 RepID=UPI0033ABFBAC
MRLHAPFTIRHAEHGLEAALDLLDGLRDLLTRQQHRPAREPYLSIISHAVEKLLPFAAPDFTATLHTATFWNLLQATGTPRQPILHRIVLHELNIQIPTLIRAREELEALKAYATRPGLPVVYDTNMLNHYNRPDTIDWRTVVRRAIGQRVTAVRLIVPQEVIGELDRQKYGEGDLARRATSAIRYLDTALLTAPPGQPAQIRENVTLETRLAPPGPAHNTDTDWQILMCADELHHLNPTAGVHVLTNDRNMRLRAGQLQLPTLTLGNEFRKDQKACTGACPRSPSPCPSL